MSTSYDTKIKSLVVLLYILFSVKADNKFSIILETI